MEKFKNKYRIPSNRLQGYDYGSHGSYFVTICTKNRERFFGRIETHNCASLYGNCASLYGNCASLYGNCASLYGNHAYLRPTTIGQIAIDYWNDIPNHYPFVELDAFVVMPDHVHGLLFFNRPGKKDRTPNQFGVQSQNLGAVIRAYKSSVKRYANQNRIVFGWQSRYHDRIVRNEPELKRIRQYIINNPKKWQSL